MNHLDLSNVCLMDIDPWELDAFSCPSITADFHKTQKDLLQTKTLLDDVRSTCVNLQDQLIDKDHFYLTREQELQELHRCELAKVETSLIDYQATAKERITSLETNLLNKESEYNKKIELIQQQYDTKIEQLEKDLDKAKSNEKDLLNRIEILAINENELRDRIQEAEDSFSERLQASVQRERDLNDKVATLTKQLEITRLEAEKRECELEEKFNLSQNEITIIRTNQNQQMATAVAAAIASASGENDDTSSPIRLKSPKNSSNINRDNINRDSITGNANNRVQMLENEVESLRCVMEIKLNDICDLRKKNQELQRANEDYEALKIKYSGMESRIEDLQIQLRAKDEEKQELVSKIKHLQETCAQEAKNRTRVVLHNEELQYRLKQNSEKFNALVTELSKSDYMSCTKTTLVNQDNSDISQNSSLTSISARSTNGHGNNVPGLTFEDDDDSPPGSPIIKGVVKKSDSVSWVLQMDDESPEVVASRMVKRAGSFRSSFNEKIQNTKRQFSLPGGPGSLNGSMICPNPLQQSSSGTMLNQNSASVHQRQHSMSESEYGSISTPRIRSKSVIVKGCSDKKPTKSLNSSQNKKIETLSSWKEPICSSSPYARHPSKLQRTSHSPPKMSSLAGANSVFKQNKVIQDGDDDEEDVTTPTEKTYCRKNSRHIIPSCDKSSAGAASNGMASHSSVTDLKALKKSQPQIQESAGEAMVSGTNSEDESCSQSSGGGDDHHHHRHHCDSPSQSLSSDLSCSNSSDHQDKINPNTLAMEEALLIDKLANSLDGTPMEVSWSSDADAFPSESIV